MGELCSGPGGLGVGCWMGFSVAGRSNWMQTFDKIIIKMRRTHHRTGLACSPLRSARTILGQLSDIDFESITETPRNCSLQLSRANPTADQFQKYTDPRSWSDSKANSNPCKRSGKTGGRQAHQTVQISQWRQDIEGWENDIQQQIDYSKQLKKLSINRRELSKMEQNTRRFKQILPQLPPTNKPTPIRINYKDEWKLNYFFNYDTDKQRKKEQDHTHRVLVNKENAKRQEDPNTGSKSQRLQRRPRREALKMLEASLLRD